MGNTPGDPPHLKDYQRWFGNETGRRVAEWARHEPDHGYAYVIQDIDGPCPIFENRFDRRRTQLDVVPTPTLLFNRSDRPVDYHWIYVVFPVGVTPIYLCFHSVEWKPFTAIAAIMDARDGYLDPRWRGKHCFAF